MDKFDQFTQQDYLAVVAVVAGDRVLKRITTPEAQFAVAVALKPEGVERDVIVEHLQIHFCAMRPNRNVGNFLDFLRLVPVYKRQA